MKQLNYIISILALIFLFNCEKESEYYNVELKEQMISLKPQKNLKGSFFLGSGTIKEIDYYYFFIKDTVYNGYKKHKIPSLETLIIEKDTIPTFIENKILKITTVQSIFKENDTILEYLNYNTLTSFFEGVEIPKNRKYLYILYVPKGVITENVDWEAL